MRAIIVEDEFYPRETLKQKLAENYPDIQVVAACKNAENGLIEILRQQPDLLFLDIQLPDKNGLWLADQLHTLACETFAPPSVIFTTAYTDSHYLLEAFRLSAVDYFVKPIQIAALKTAIEKFKKHTNPEGNLQTLMNVLKTENILKFKDFNGLLLLKSEEILCIKAEGNYAILMTKDGKEVDIFERLGEIEKRLPTDTFIRIDRSHIVNRQYIRQLNRRKLLLSLSSGNSIIEIPLSENSIKNLQEVI